MKSKARKHHYLPQSYLAEFTDSKSKEGQFYVLDIHSNSSFRTTPLKVAAVRDFNRVDIDGQPLDVIEKALSPFENYVAQAIRNVNRTKAFPNDENCNDILNLISLIAVRNPQRRNSFNQAREAEIHLLGDLLVSSEKIWNYHLKKAQEAGDVKENNVSYEEAKRFIKERRYEIDLPREENIRVEFNAHDKLLPMLGQRTWTLLVAPNSGPYFICSDHPVALNSKRAIYKGPIGFELANTEVFFPLGPCTGFYGVYEEFLSPVLNITPAQVALINRCVVENAERHVFTTEDNFFIWHEGSLKKVSLKTKNR